MQGWESARWLVIGITLPENRHMVRFCSKSIHIFDRNAIHIQAFVHFINGKLMSGHSSSSTFHDFQEVILSNYQKSRNSEFQ